MVRPGRSDPINQVAQELHEAYQFAKPLEDNAVEGTINVASEDGWADRLLPAYAARIGACDAESCVGWGEQGLEGVIGGPLREVSKMFGRDGPREGGGVGQAGGEDLLHALSKAQFEANGAVGFGWVLVFFPGFRNRYDLGDFPAWRGY